MYRYSEDAPRKKPLTKKLIRKNLLRSTAGLCLILAIITPLLGLPMVLVIASQLRSAQTTTETAKAAALLAMVIAFLAVFYAICIVRLWRIYRTRTIVIPDTVIYIDRLDGKFSPSVWVQRWRNDPYYELHFQGGGIYRGIRPIERDGVGDEFYVVCFENNPQQIVDLYRTTEYEWVHDTDTISHT